MVNSKYKLFWHKLFLSYLIACYISRIPAFFIDWQKGVPSEGSPPNILEELISFFLSPVLAPLALFVETKLAFIWGDVMYERLLPLGTFLIVALISWIVFNKILKTNGSITS